MDKAKIDKMSGAYSALPLLLSHFPIFFFVAWRQVILI